MTDLPEMRNALTEPYYKQPPSVRGNPFGKPLLKTMGSEPLTNLYWYDMQDLHTDIVGYALAVRKSSLMDFFCAKSSLLRQCHLVHERDSAGVVTLSFGYVGLESDIQYMGVMYDQGRVAFHCTFGREPDGVYKKVTTQRIDIKTQAFVELCEHMADYLLSGDDLLLRGYIQEVELLGDHSEDAL